MKSTLELIAEKDKLEEEAKTLLEKAEKEERKLNEGEDLEYNNLLKQIADKTEAEYLNKLFQIGSITPNEIRRRLDLPALDNGDSAFVQVNIQTLDNAVNNINTENEGNKSLQEANKKK